MIRALFGIFSITLAISLAPSPAAAVSEDVFVVPRVTVQANASSATAAKAAAQRQGRRRAMDILLRRLTVEDDWIYLPRLSRGETSAAFSAIDRNAVVLNDADLETLESGFEVYNEKSSSATYRAMITYRFKPAAVRKLLKDARIPYSEAQTRTALVLPVLETASNLYLWEEQNPWKTAWRSRPYNNELTPMSAPLGDLEDAATISARQALSLNQDALAAMAERYSVSQVIIAHAFLRQVDGEDRLRVRFINGLRESGEIGPIDEILSVAGDYEGDVNRANELDDVVAARVGDVLAEEWFTQASGNFPALAERSIDATIAKYAKPWKERTLIDHTVAALLELSAHYQTLNEWTKIRAALVSTPLVGSVQVVSLSRGGAEMLVRAYGDPSKLIVAMEAQGLALWTENGESWQIAVPNTARGVRIREKRSSLFPPALGATPASFDGAEHALGAGD